MVVHDSESGGTIVHPPIGMNGVASPQLAAVTLVGGGASLVQGLELYIQVVQGSSGAGSGWGCSMHQEDCSRGCQQGSYQRPANAGGPGQMGQLCWG